MSKFKVGDLVTVQAKVVEVADFDDWQLVNIEFLEGKDTRWLPGADLRLVKRKRPKVAVELADALIAEGKK